MRVGAWLLVAAAVLALASAGPAAAASRSPEAALERLTVVIGNHDAGFAQLYVAKHTGLFEAQGLDVNIAVSVAIVQQLVSGQADLSFSGTTAAFGPAASGNPMSIIYGTAGGGLGAYTIAGPSNVTSISQCRRMASSFAGTSTYAWANYLKRTMRLGYDVIPVASTAARAATLVSGNADCMNSSPGSLVPLVDAGRAHFILDPRNKARLPRNFPRELSEIGVFGSTEHLKDIRPRVVSFMRAMNNASRVLVSRSPRELAALVKREPGLSATSEDDIAKALELLKPFFLPRSGYVAANVWPQQLQWLTDAGLGLDFGDSKFSYRSMVDMSFYNQVVLGTRTASSDRVHNTLEKIAAWKLGDRTQWRSIFRFNRAVFTKLGVTQAKARTFRLPLRTRIRY
jgi:ABC-type nitrate/sulfonate/bicarbonate transport system substrate-binding protein